MKYSILIPIYNEEIAIKKTVENLHQHIKNQLNDFEIIAINDGSSDKTLDVLKEINLPDFKFLSHPYNKGYGASLKTGAHKAQGDYLIFYDGDGQHNPEDLIRIINNKEGYDMVIGARKGYQGPLLRQPGKKILNILANYLVDFKIPDLNSGLRLIKKNIFFKFDHLYPNKFSLTTTVTLAFLKQAYNVKYIPITINKREGKSTVKFSDGIKTINLIFRMIMLFSPFKIFAPASMFFFIASICSILFSIFLVGKINISDTTLILFFLSVFLFFIGLIADQISSLRREIKL